MERPLVSIIMPVYNAELFLKRAIDSIISQTYTNIEFIIINDGSTDNSLKIIQSYEDTRIKLIDNDGNKGLIDSLNIGIEKSNGEYIARMDADDESYQQRLEKQVSYLESHPTVGVLGTFIEGESKFKIYSNKKLSSNDLKARLIFNNIFNHPTVMFRSNILKKSKVHYNPHFKHAEDYNLWFNLVPQTNFAILREPLLYYENHHNQVSQTYQLQQVASTLKTQHMFFDLIKLSCNDTEKEIHRKLYYQDFEFSLDALKEIENWLIKIKNNIQFETLVTKHALDKIIAVIWFETCTHFASNGVKCFDQYKTSDCKGSKFISLYYKLTFYAKKII